MAASQFSTTKRSSTGHNLLPASQPSLHREPVHPVKLISWTFGRGSVVWRIWPAVLLHTSFAAAIVTISIKTEYNLEIPNVMLTVLGVVIGFVISYRASSGYDRYWMGRTCWSDIIRNSRSITRLVWFHVPPRLTPKTPAEIESGVVNRSAKEMNQVMSEKRMAIDLVEGFSVALKHHLRGELGIYYEDLYHLIRPLHGHDHSSRHHHSAESSVIQSPRKAQRIANLPPMPRPRPSPHPSNHDIVDFVDPVIPPINSYGTFDSTALSSSPSGSISKRRNSSSSSLSSDSSRSVSRPLLPSAMPVPDSVMGKVARDLIPFASVYTSLCRWFKRKLSIERPLEVLPPGVDVVESEGDCPCGVQRPWSGPVYSDRLYPGLRHLIRRPCVAGGGENLPLEILRCLSEWFSVLEDRGTVPGTTLGSLISYLSTFEESLSALEKIFTTPLPFVYSVHIRHTVWLYLFFLPFQLVGLFKWYAIPGVGIAAFIYLGFLAAGEEIEQPFGYDENDLDLDLFIRDIIHADIAHIKTSPCLNAYFGPERHEPVHRRSLTLVEASGMARNRGEEEDTEELIGPTS